MYTILLSFAKKHITWLIIALLVSFILVSRRSSLNQVSQLWGTINGLQMTLNHTKEFASKLSTKLEVSKQVERQLVTKLSFASDSLNAVWAEKIDAVRGSIKKENEVLRGVVLVEGRWKNLADSLVGVLQFNIPGRVNFERVFNTVTVNGYTLIDPPFAYVEVKRSPVGLSVVITEREDEIHNVYVVSSDPDLIFSRVESSFIGFESKRSFWDLLRDAPRMRVGFVGNDGYISAGLSFWRIGLESRLGTEVTGFGINFNLLGG